MAAILGAFLAVYAAMAVAAWRRPLLARLAWRESVRRPGQSAVLVAGLMVGGAAILSGQVFLDSVTGSLGASAEYAWGKVDITVGARGAFFDPAVARVLAADQHVTAAQAGVELAGSIGDLDRTLGEPVVSVVGFDPITQGAFGAYQTEDGGTTDGQDLAPGEVLLSKSLADSLQARAGDRLVLSVGQESADYQVGGVAMPKGPGDYGLRPSVFVPLSSLVRLTGAEINIVRVAARGDSHETAISLRSDLASLADASRFEVREAKAEDVASNRRLREVGRPFWTSISLLIAVLGGLLVVNLVLALAEERRPRLAVLRAVGMSREGVALAFLFEGALYSVVAAALSVLPGLLLTALLLAMTRSASDVGVAAGYPATYELVLKPLTIAGAVAAGALVTLAGVLVATFHGTGMAISSALRELPDPARATHPRLRASLLGLAAAAGVACVAAGPVPRAIGGMVLIGVAAAVARGRLPDRARSSLAGLALTAWAILEFQQTGVNLIDPTSVALLFLSITGSVFGAAMLVAANLRVLESLAGRLLGGRGQALMRPPMAYLTRRPIRSGLAAGAFGLAVALLTVLAMYSASLEPDYSAASMGYDVVARSASSSAIELPASIQRQVASQASIVTRTYLGPVREAPSSAQPETGWMRQQIFLYEFTADQLATPPALLTSRNPRFATDAEAWRAVRESTGWVMVTSTSPVDTPAWIRLVGATGEIQFQVAGALQPGIYRGVIGSSATVVPFAGVPAGSTMLLKAAPGVDARRLALNVRRSLFAGGVDAATTHDLLDEGSAADRESGAYIVLLMRVGLVVGALGLALIQLRAVVERRRSIGVLRALGYQPGAVQGGVLTEAMLTASAGIVAGLAAGLLISYSLMTHGLMRHGIGVDALGILGTLLAVYTAVLAVCVLPAVQASRQHPAQSLRLAG